MNRVAIVRTQDSITFALLDNKMNIKGSTKSILFDPIDLSEEKIDWHASLDQKSNYIFGIANYDIEQITIESPIHMIPNKINSNGIWVFYNVFNSSDQLPVIINGFDREGNLLYGK